jgi:hypothetical protein
VVAVAVAEGEMVAVAEDLLIGIAAAVAVVVAVVLQMTVNTAVAVMVAMDLLIQVDLLLTAAAVVAVMAAEDLPGLALAAVTGIEIDLLLPIILMVVVHLPHVIENHVRGIETDFLWITEKEIKSGMTEIERMAVLVENVVDGSQSLAHLDVALLLNKECSLLMTLVLLQSNIEA